MKLHDFRIQFEPKGGATYLVTGRSALGDTIAKDLIPQKSLEEAAIFVPRLAQGDVDGETLREWGNALFHIVFFDELKKFYVHAQMLAQERGEGLRVILEFEPTADRAVHEVPWELLHDGQDFIAMQGDRSLVRYIVLGGEIKSLRVEPRLRILVTTANNPEHPHLDFTSECQVISNRADTSSGKISVTIKTIDSFSELMWLFNLERNRNMPYHLWHHSGHGEHDSTSGAFRLVLGQRGQYASNHDIGRLLQAQPQIRLIVLNICMGGSGAGLATHLAKLNCPAVISHRGTIRDERARYFAKALYATNALFTQPLEQTVTTVRQQLHNRYGGTDWALPSLYLRTSDSILLHQPAPSQATNLPESLNSWLGMVIGGNLDAKNVTVIQNATISDDGTIPDVPHTPMQFQPTALTSENLTVIGTLNVSGKEAIARWRTIIDGLRQS